MKQLFLWFPISSAETGPQRLIIKLCSIDWRTGCISVSFWVVLIIPVATPKFSSTSLVYGVPQASVLGPLLSLLHLLLLQHIWSAFRDIFYHYCADDIRLYIFFKSQDVLWLY